MDEHEFEAFLTTPIGRLWTGLSGRSWRGRAGPRGAAGPSRAVAGPGRRYRRGRAGAARSHGPWGVMMALREALAQPARSIPRSPCGRPVRCSRPRLATPSASSRPGPAPRALRSAWPRSACGGRSQSCSPRRPRRGRRSPSGPWRSRAPGGRAALGQHHEADLADLERQPAGQAADGEHLAADLVDVRVAPLDDLGHRRQAPWRRPRSLRGSCVSPSAARCLLRSAWPRPARGRSRSQSATSAASSAARSSNSSPTWARASVGRRPRPAGLGQRLEGDVGDLQDQVGRSPRRWRRTSCRRPHRRGRRPT